MASVVRTYIYIIHIYRFRDTYNAFVPVVNSSSCAVSIRRINSTHTHTRAGTATAIVAVTGGKTETEIEIETRTEIRGVRRMIEGGDLEMKGATVTHGKSARERNEMRRARSTRRWRRMHRVAVAGEEEDRMMTLTTTKSPQLLAHRVLMVIAV